MIDGLLQSLDSRFQTDQEVMEAAVIVKLELWPEKLTDDEGM